MIRFHEVFRNREKEPGAAEPASLAGLVRRTTETERTEILRRPPTRVLGPDGGSPGGSPPLPVERPQTARRLRPPAEAAPASLPSPISPSSPPPAPAPRADENIAAIKLHVPGPGSEEAPWMMAQTPPPPAKKEVPIVKFDETPPPEDPPAPPPEAPGIVEPLPQKVTEEIAIQGLPEIEKPGDPEGRARTVRPKTGPIPREVSLALEDLLSSRLNPRRKSDRKEIPDLAPAKPPTAPAAASAPDDGEWELSLDEVLRRYSDPPAGEGSSKGEKAASEAPDATDGLFDGLI